MPDHSATFSYSPRCLLLFQTILLLCEQKLTGPCESLTANYHTRNNAESHTWAADVDGIIQSMSSLASCVTFAAALHRAASRTVWVATYNIHTSSDVIFWTYRIPNCFFSLIRNCLLSKLDSQWLLPLINLAPPTRLLGKSSRGNIINIIYG